MLLLVALPVAVTSTFAGATNANPSRPDRGAQVRERIFQHTKAIYQEEVSAYLSANGLTQDPIPPSFMKNYRASILSFPTQELKPYRRRENPEATQWFRDEIRTELLLHDSSASYVFATGQARKILEYKILSNFVFSFLVFFGAYFFAPPLFRKVTR